MPRYKGGFFDDTIEPPISRQKTVHKSKADGSRETSHTIEHDTTVSALRGARKGRGDKRPIRKSPFRSLEYIATHAHPPAISEDGKTHHYEDGTTSHGMTHLIDDRRQNADPRSERPAPAVRNFGGLPLLDPQDHPWTDAAGSAPRLRKARQDPRLERPSPLDTESEGYGFPADPFYGEFPTGTAGDVMPQPTQNIYTGEDRYYNPVDEFDRSEDFNIGTGKMRRKNRRKRPQDQGTMGRADIFDAVTAAMRRSR